MNIPKSQPVPLIVISDFDLKLKPPETGDTPQTNTSQTEPSREERDGLEIKKEEDSVKKEPKRENTALIKHKVGN